MAKKTGISTEAMVGVGATVAAVSAAAYMLFGPDAKKNRKTVRGWAVKMKGEIIENFEKAQHISEPVYHEIIDRVVAKYEKAKDIDPAELKSVVSDIRKHWKALSKNSKPKAKAVVKKTISKAKKAVSSKAKSK
jgi:hypothetical protein